MDAVSFLLRAVLNNEALVSDRNPVATGFQVPVEVTTTSEPLQRTVISSEEPFVNVTPDAAQVLVETLFAGLHQRIPDVTYAIAYKLAEGRCGGDIIDVFHYDNNAVSIVVADIAGKGTQAAVHAAMIKYSLRAFASCGMVPERAVHALDRLYLENNVFEGTPNSFASLFFGVVDASRRFLHYTNAGHEPVALMAADGTATMLMPTAPIVGIFDSQHDLFRQNVVPLDAGTLLVVTTDGVTEARNAASEQFGMPRLVDIMREHRDASETDVAQAILRAVEDFSLGKKRDDIAILAMRFL